MHRSNRRLSTIVWLGIYTAISLCSSALHGVEGGRHGLDPHSMGRSVSGFAKCGAETTSSLSASIDDVIDGGDCLVCAYLDEAQSARLVSSCTSVDHVAFSRSVRSRIKPHPRDSLPSRPRAPPPPPPIFAQG